MASSESTRKLPNILITGTPGVGKTSTAAMIAEKLDYKHLNVGDIVERESCHNGKDETYDSFILDDDKLVDCMEPMMENGGVVADFHTCEVFPERWFDLVLVLRADTAVLFDRLEARGYSEKKRTENIECEIMQIVLEEAQESYAEEIVHEVQSNSVEDMEANIGRIVQWSKNWIENNSSD